MDKQYHVANNKRVARIKSSTYPNRLPGINGGFVGDKMVPSGIPQSVDLQSKLTQLHIQEWLTEDVFHIRWWILIGSLTAMFLAWYLLLDKTKKKEACLFIVLAIIIELAIDEDGEELILWEYPTDLIPIFPPLTSLNLISVPLSLSIAFQRYPELKRFTIAAVIITAVISFVLEPLLALGGLYESTSYRCFHRSPRSISHVCRLFICSSISGLAHGVNSLSQP